MNALRNNYRLLIIFAGILSTGCRNSQKKYTDFDSYIWLDMKTSFRAPSTSLDSQMWLRCVVLDGHSVELEEGLHNWDSIENLRDLRGDKVLVRAACAIEGLKDCAAETGYYLTAVNSDAWPKSLHGLRFQVHEVRIEGQELSFKTEVSFGRHGADVATHDGRLGLRVWPSTTHFDRAIHVRMRSNQVQVINLGFGSYFALIEIIDAPIISTYVKLPK